MVLEYEARRPATQWPEFKTVFWHLQAWHDRLFFKATLDKVVFVAAIFDFWKIFLTTSLDISPAESVETKTGVFSHNTKVFFFSPTKYNHVITKALWQRNIENRTQRNIKLHHICDFQERTMTKFFLPFGVKIQMTVSLNGLFL